MTIELGDSLPELDAFLTEFANPKRAALVTAKEQIDLTKAGTQALTFRHGSKEETVTLTIQDTIAPQAVVKEVDADLDAELKADAFIEKIIDFAQVTVEFAEAPTAPESYGEQTVQIRLTDASGNTTVVTSKVFYYWIRNSVTLELGQTLTKADLLLDPERDEALIDQAQIDAINAGGVGTYTVTSTSGDTTKECTVTVQDTTAPALELKEVTIYTDATATVENFVKSATDISGEVKLKLITELSFGTAGSQTVIIEATDKNGNVTQAETTLNIIQDTAGPGFYGVTEITINKNQTPDYLKGVYAYDAKDGVVAFTHNANNVDITKAGTYYVTYSATDLSGNTSTYRRKVTVKHDASDTAELVRSIAASLPDDPKQIRDYVRKSIVYSYDWGGEDPVWFGFTNKYGNCYVHALCLQAILTEKGYTTQLIWVTDKSHYWLIIETEDGWRHIDATPGTSHTKYFELMTDKMRKETLSGRDWDRSQWPACE